MARLPEIGLAVVLCVSSASAQVPAAKMTEAQKIDFYIDMLVRIKTAVGQQKSTAAPLYRAVSLRVMTCAVVYGMFSKNPRNDDPTQAGYSVAAELYAKVAGSLYPGPPSEFKKELDKLQNDFLTAKKDKKASFYLVRNCKDLSDSDPQNVSSAVMEIALQQPFPR
jgi:hypothetical protein